MCIILSVSRSYFFASYFEIPSICSALNTEYTLDTSRILLSYSSGVRFSSSSRASAYDIFFFFCVSYNDQNSTGVPFEPLIIFHPLLDACLKVHHLGSSHPSIFWMNDSHILFIPRYLVFVTAFTGLSVLHAMCQGMVSSERHLMNSLTISSLILVLPAIFTSS